MMRSGSPDSLGFGQTYQQPGDLVDIVSTINEFELDVGILRSQAEAATANTRPQDSIDQPVEVGKAAMKVAIAMLTAQSSQVALKSSAQATSNVAAAMALMSKLGDAKYAYPEGFAGEPQPQPLFDALLAILFPGASASVATAEDAIVEQAAAENPATVGGAGSQKSRTAAKAEKKAERRAARRASKAEKKQSAEQTAVRTLLNKFEASLATNLLGALAKTPLDQLDLAELTALGIDGCEIMNWASSAPGKKGRARLAPLFNPEGEARRVLLTYVTQAVAMVQVYTATPPADPKTTLIGQMQKARNVSSNRAITTFVDGQITFMKPLERVAQKRDIFLGLAQALQAMFDKPEDLPGYQDALTMLLERLLLRFQSEINTFSTSDGPIRGKALYTPESFLALARSIIILAERVHSRAAAFAAQLLKAIEPKELGSIFSQDKATLLSLVNLAYSVDQRLTGAAALNRVVNAANLVEDALSVTDDAVPWLELVQKGVATEAEVRELRAAKATHDSEPAGRDTGYQTLRDTFKARMTASTGLTHAASRVDKIHKDDMGDQQFDVNQLIDIAFTNIASLLEHFATSTLPVPDDDALETQIVAYRELIAADKLDDLPEGFPKDEIIAALAEGPVEAAVEARALKAEVRAALREPIQALSEASQLAALESSAQAKERAMLLLIRQFVYSKNGLDKRLAETLCPDRPALPTHFHPIVRDMLLHDSAAFDAETPHLNHRLSGVFNDLAVSDEGALHVLWLPVLLTKPGQLYGLQQLQCNVVDHTINPLLDLGVAPSIRVVVLTELLARLGERASSTEVSKQIDTWMLATLIQEVIRKHSERSEVEFGVKPHFSVQETRLHIQLNEFASALRDRLLQQFPRDIVIKYAERVVSAPDFAGLSEIDEAAWGGCSIDEALAMLTSIEASLAGDSGDGYWEVVGPLSALNDPDSDEEPVLAAAGEHLTIDGGSDLALALRLAAEQARSAHDGSQPGLPPAGALAAGLHSPGSDGNASEESDHEYLNVDGAPGSNGSQSDGSEPGDALAGVAFVLTSGV